MTDLAKPGDEVDADSGVARAPEADHDAPRPDLRILSTRVYRGPNYWSPEKAVNLTVDLGSLERWPTSRIPGFTERLLELLPGLDEHHCSRGHRGGFVERLHEGTWLGHVAEHAAIALQRLTGAENRRGKTRGTGEPGRYHVIYGYSDETVALEAGRLAVRLVNHLVEPDPAFSFDDEVEALIRLANRAAFGPSTQAIIDEAVSRDIPYMRLDRHSLVQLGQGVHQRRIRATMTSQTSSLGVDIAGNKELTKQLLRAAGLPTPDGENVRTEADALEVARRIGYPLAVKPLDGNHGRGVTLAITDEDGVRAAFAVAKGESRRGGVIVERQLAGRDYRALVVGGRIAAIAERVPAHVVGDGRRTVRELVDAANEDPRRGIGHEKVLTRIRVDEAAEALVRAQGLALDDVAPAGQTVQLALTANMSTGGISIDRTFEAHFDNVEIAEQAAQVVGLDVAGIDIIAPDITETLYGSGGGIVEVNAAPGFRMHTHPTIGEPQYVAKPVLDLLFPPGTPSRIPVVAVTGTNGKTTTARMIAHILRGMGRHVGLTSTDGVFIGGRRILAADASGPKSARMVLQNPGVDTAVFEVARGGILREGLGYDRNDVGVVLNVAPDHLGLGGIDTMRKLAAVKQVVVEAVPRDGFAVLNADDPRVVRMRNACAGTTILFSTDPASDLVETHCVRGGRAVQLERGESGETIVLRHGTRRMHIAWTGQIPATFQGRARMNVQNAMAAAAAAFAAGASLQDVRQGLRTFDTSFFLAPGRLNVADLHEGSVIVDYCHNAPAMRLLGDFVDRLAASAETPETPRRIGVIGTAGDRRDQDIRDLGAVAAAHFDVLLVREDEKRRGRAPGATAALVEEGARTAMARGALCREVVVERDELVACQRALDMMARGDIVALCVDRTGDVWDLVQARQRAVLGGTAEGDPPAA